MPATVLIGVFALCVILVIFGITWKLIGLKAAFLASGVTLIISSILYAAMIFAIVRAMD